jgi:hypothetical protein
MRPNPPSGCGEPEEGQLLVLTLVNLLLANAIVWFAVALAFSLASPCGCD